MAQDESATPEVFFYRVTCTEEVPMSPARHPGACCLLLLPREPMEITQDTRTAPGRWYRFRSLKRPQWIPMTPDQAEGFRGEGWRVEGPRPARSEEEHALVAHRRKRLDEEQDLAERRVARRQTEIASLKAQEQERVDQLWLVRLFRKTFAELVPSPWHEVRLAYDEQWCKTRGIRYEVKNGGCTWWPLESVEKPDGVYSPEFDAIRCIVLCWADGVDKPALAEAIRVWRDEFLPLFRRLKPVTNVARPGQALFTYLTEQIPRARPQLEQTIDSLPDSPPALAKLLENYRPIVDALRSLAEPADTNPLHTIATSAELSTLNGLIRRSGRLAALLDEAERSLEASGWFVEKGKLKMRTGKRGSRPLYLSHIVWGLYSYLWPMYKRTFGDDTENPIGLRRHISRLLSPYFPAPSISPKEGGPLQRHIGNLLERDGRLKAIKAEAEEYPAAADLPPVPEVASLLPKDHF